MEDLKVILQNGADPYWRDPDGNNMIRLIIQQLPYAYQRIDGFLTLNVEIEIKDMHFAIRNGERIWLIGMIKSKMTALDEITAYGLYRECLSSYVTPLGYSIQPALLAMMEIIKELTGFPPRTACLLSAMSMTLLEVAGLLIKLGAPIDKRVLSLHQFNHYHLTTILLDHGMNPNFLFSNGASVLMSCIGRNHSSTSTLSDVHAALRHGADPNYCSVSGITPLLLACTLNVSNKLVQIRIVLLLLQYGVKWSYLYGRKDVNPRIILCIEAFVRCRELKKAAGDKFGQFNTNSFPAELLSRILRLMVPRLDLE